MIPIEAKIIAMLLLVLSIVGGYFYVDHLRKENARLTTDLELANWAASEHERLAKEDREFARIALEKQDEFTRENDRLRADLESGRKRMYIKTIQTCPSQTGLPPEVRETNAEISPEVRRNIFDFRAILGQTVIDFDDCKARLKALSN